MKSTKNNQFVIEFSKERIISPSGLAIVGGMLGKSDLVKRLNRIPVDEKKRSEPQIKNGDIALTYIGLLAQGKTEYDAVKEMADDPEFFKGSSVRSRRRRRCVSGWMTWGIRVGRTFCRQT